MIVVRGHDPTADVNALSFSPDGQRLASSATDGFAKLWDVARLADGVPVWAADTASGGWLSHVQFAPDGGSVLGCGGRAVWMWAAADGRLLHRLDSTQANTSVLVCSADGRFVAWTGGYLYAPARIQTAGLARLAPHRQLRGHRNATGILAAGPDGLVSGSADRRVRFWDWDTGRMYHELTLRGYVRALAVSRAGDRLAAACSGVVYVWPLERPPGSRRKWRVPGAVRELRGHSRAVLCADFAPDGGRLATASEDGTVRVWDAGSGAEVRAFAPRLGPLHWVTFAPDGLTLAFSSQRGHIGLLDVDA